MGVQAGEGGEGVVGSAREGGVVSDEAGAQAVVRGVHRGEGVAQLLGGLAGAGAGVSVPPGAQ